MPLFGPMRADVRLLEELVLPQWRRKGLKSFVHIRITSVAATLACKRRVPTGWGQLHRELHPHPPSIFGFVRLNLVTILSQRVTNILQFLVDP